MEYLSKLFESDFMPNGHCLQWQPDIPWLNVGSDAAIALAYFTIPAALAWFVRRRSDVTFGWVFWMFGAFILLCGMTHAAEIWTVWNPTYRFEGVLKALTAGMSAATAGALLPFLPKALSLPRPSALESANRELLREVAERERAEAELRSARAELEDRVHQRTHALEQANLALTREIAQRERAEERFRNAVESSPHGMLMIDARARIVLLNRATERIFGYTREELIGASVETLVPERFRDAHPAHRAAFFARPDVRPMGADRDLFGRQKDGSEVPLEIGLNPILTGEGVFTLSSIVDITERKRSEEMIREKIRQLECSNRNLDEFAHVVSHDLKAPLRGIASLAEWVLKDCADALSDTTKDHLELLMGRAERMGELIDGILAYSRAGRNPSVETVDTQALVKEVLDSLAPPESIRVRIDGPLPEVRYDRTQLAQVLQNLIGNAIEHLGRPSGEVTVSCRERDGPLELRVRDDGTGIEERHFGRIFKMFQSLRSHGNGSSGVGLAIVKKIVESHGGSVSVESTLGSGTTFRFTVPRDACG